MQATTPLTPTQNAVLWFVRLYLLAALAWIAWGWINYAGVFRWVSRLQVEIMGEYSDKLSVIASFVLVAIPAGVLSQVFGVEKVLMGLHRGANARPVSQARIVGYVAMAAFVVAAGGVAWAIAPHAPPTMGELDLRAGARPPPDADRVTVTGFQQPPLASTLVTTTSGHEDRTTYTPLTGPGWRPGDPVTYFLESGQNAVVPIPFSRGATTSQIAGETRVEAGILTRNGLPGILLDDYARNGVRVAEPNYVVAYADASTAPYDGYIVAGIAGVFGIFLAFAALLMWLRARYVARSARLRSSPQ